MAQYKNYITTKKIVAPSVLAENTDSAPLTNATTRSKRNSRGRQFYQAMAYLSNNAQNNYAVQLQVVSGSTVYILDRVTLQANESYVWNERDYGVDLANDEYVRLSYTSAGSHANDKLHLFIRTRDLV
tara:strand:+ start:180 stop:563 length:384 start_codon:yes stop_codon:yes gene_type:complete